MSNETSQPPQMRISMRSYPLGQSQAQKDGVGRTIWRYTARGIGFIGLISSPFTDAWASVGGPGGDAGVVGSNFLRRIGMMGDFNRQVYKPRVTTSPASVQMLLQAQNGTVNFTADQTETVEKALNARYDATLDAVYRSNY